MRHLWDSSWAPLDGAGVLQRAPREPQDGPKKALGANRSGASHGPASDAPLGSPFGALSRPSWAPQDGPRVPRRAPREPRGGPERAPREPQGPTEVEHFKSSVQMLHSGSILVPSKGPHGPKMAALEAPRSPREGPKKPPREPQDATGADRKLTETALVATARFLSRILWGPSHCRAWALL